MDPVEGLEILEMRFQNVRGKNVSDRDVQTSGVLEEITFTHEGQETEIDYMVVPLYVSFLLFGGEYPPLVLPRKMKYLVDQTSSRSEHRFAGQRTSLESLHIVLEHIHNEVDYFLVETHAPPVDFGCDRTKIDYLGGLRFDGFGEE